MGLNMSDTLVIGYAIGFILGTAGSLDRKDRYIFFGIGIVGYILPRLLGVMGWINAT